VPGPRGLAVLPECKGWVAATIRNRFDLGDHVGFLVEPFVAEAPRADDPQLSFQTVRDLDPGHPA
jgi:flavin reductase (DIM6/NTAB) family NADH-FMN oxidoreductase RutF